MLPAMIPDVGDVLGTLDLRFERGQCMVYAPWCVVIGPRYVNRTFLRDEVMLLRSRRERTCCLFTRSKELQERFYHPYIPLTMSRLELSYHLLHGFYVTLTLL